MSRVAALMFVAACWRGGSTPPAEPAPLANKQPEAPPPLRDQEETPMMALERFTNEMCHCTTSECATQVSNDLTTWAQTIARDNPDATHDLSELDQRRANDLATRMGACMMKAMTSSSSPPSTNPPVGP